MRWAVLPLLLAGCPYTAPSNNVPSDGPIDITIVPDVLPDPELCTDDTSSMCIGNVLRECETVGELPVTTPCAICTGAPAHCEELVPSADAATTADLAPNGLIIDTAIAVAAIANTEDGSISGVRPQGEGVINGIGYRRTNGAGIWTFHELAINASINFEGNRAAVFAANRSIVVNAVLDVRGPCSILEPSPGGSQGGGPEQDGSGAGKGIRGAGAVDDASGASGGGHGVAGSGGGASTNQTATTGGTAHGTAEITQLRGGSGGGGGGGETFTAGTGGAGGGVLQLVANDAITFNSAGGVNAGGCGADRNLLHDAAGGGGGAGGTILFESSAVTINAGAVLAVNGGGGGGGDSAGQGGQNGQLSRTAATGGNGTPNGNGTTGGKGGAGGAPGALGGTVGVSGSSATNAGGGGGAIGRIRITTRDNAMLTGDCATCSPNFADAATTATRGAATIQVVP